MSTGRVDERLVVAADARPARLTREERTISLTTTEGLTIADLEAMPDDGHRYELLGGSIVVNAAPTPRHQLASGTLYDRLKAGCPSDHLVLYAPVDLPSGAREYRVVAESDEKIDVDDPLAVSVPLAALFAPPR